MRIRELLDRVASPAEWRLISSDIVDYNTRSMSRGVWPRGARSSARSCRARCHPFAAEGEGGGPVAVPSGWGGKPYALGPFDRSLEAEATGVAHAPDGELTLRLSRAMPFEPTSAQARAMGEIGDAMSRPPNRRTYLHLLQDIASDTETTAVPIDQKQFDQDVALFTVRLDKAWSLTDCTSFVVMKEHGLTEALTTDHHFTQAGFHALLAVR